MEAFVVVVVVAIAGLWFVSNHFQKQRIAQWQAEEAEKQRKLEIMRLEQEAWEKGMQRRRAEEASRPVLYTAKGVELFSPLRVKGHSIIAQRSKEETTSSYQSAMMIAQEMRERGYTEIQLFARRADGKEYQWGSVGQKGDWLDIQGA